MQLRGSFVALVTPFTHTGVVDFRTLEELILWHIEEGSDGIVLCGTTGESPTLSTQEKLAIFETGVRVAKGKIVIVAGVGSYSTEDSVSLCLGAKALGVDGALVVVPYYNRPTPEGCFLHYEQLNRVELPMIVYHHPGRTGVKLSVETLERICSLSHVVGIKECSCDMSFAVDLFQTVKCPIFAGDDGLIVPMMASGACGIISVVANAIPRMWKELTTLLLDGHLGEAQMVFARYYPLISALGLETNPQPIKYALSLLGKCRPTYRLPLIPPAPSTQEAIRAVFLPQEGVHFFRQEGCHLGRCPACEMG